MRTDENVVARVHGNAPYKVIFISENLESFASENWNPGLWNPEFSLRNPESAFPWQVIRNPENTWNLESIPWDPESNTVLDFFTWSLWKLLSPGYGLLVTWSWSLTGDPSAYARYAVRITTRMFDMSELRCKCKNYFNETSNNRKLGIAGDNDRR